MSGRTVSRITQSNELLFNCPVPDIAVPLVMSSMASSALARATASIPQEPAILKSISLTDLWPSTISTLLPERIESPGSERLLS